MRIVARSVFAMACALLTAGFWITVLMLAYLLSGRDPIDMAADGTLLSGPGLVACGVGIAGVVAHALLSRTRYRFLRRSDRAHG